MFDLKELLELRRPNGSKTEAAFVKDLERRLRDAGHNPYVDSFGNITVDNGGSVVFTAHTDTVHDAKSEGKQELVETVDGVLVLANPVAGDVLGADDGTGIYIMLQLLQAGVKGRYVFFRAEEVGGLGSESYAEEFKSELERYKYAVAFDRKGVTDIITHQWGGRCCSDEFAEALAGQLDLGMKPCNGGTFTDTANLTHLIPECTNVAVGYYSQHTSGESQDLVFLEKLIQKLIQVDWDALPVVREAGLEVDDLDYGWGSYDSGRSSYKRDSQMENLIDMFWVGAITADDLVYQSPDEAAKLIEYLVFN